jgi:hypothetical protein
LEKFCKMQKAIQGSNKLNQKIDKLYQYNYFLFEKCNHLSLIRLSITRYTHTRVTSLEQLSLAEFNGE